MIEPIASQLKIRPKKLRKKRSTIRASIFFADTTGARTKRQNDIPSRDRPVAAPRSGVPEGPQRRRRQKPIVIIVLA
jgi:hypothetical protein